MDSPLPKMLRAEHNPTRYDVVRWMGGHDQAQQIVAWCRAMGTSAEYVSAGYRIGWRVLGEAYDGPSLPCIQVQRSTPPGSRHAEFVSIYEGDWLVFNEATQTFTVVDRETFDDEYFLNVERQSVHRFQLDNVRTLAETYLASDDRTAYEIGRQLKVALGNIPGPPAYDDRVPVPFDDQAAFPEYRAELGGFELPPDLQAVVDHGRAHPEKARPRPERPKKEGTDG